MIPSMAAGVKDRLTVYARVFLCDQGCEGQMGLANKLEQGGSCEKGSGLVQFFSPPYLCSLVEIHFFGEIGRAHV